MARSRYPLIARQGWVFIAATVVAAGLVWHFYGFRWSVPVFVLALGVAYLFRDPNRLIPSTPLGVVSPADGVIETVEQQRDPYLDRDAIRVVLNMRGTDVYTTRSPIEGKIMDMVSAVKDADSVPHGVWIKTDEGDDIIVAMARGSLHNAPRCYVQCGDRVGQGQRCGYIYFGSKIEVYLPVNSRIDVKTGDHVHSGSDLLGVLVHKPAAS